MKRWALISGDSCVTVVEQEQKPTSPGKWRDVTGQDVGPGWREGHLGSWVRPEQQELQVPASITMRQARLVLHEIGRLAAVESAINALPEPARTKARIEWDYSNELLRKNAFVAILGQAIGLTSNEVDALFIQAAAIP